MSRSYFLKPWPLAFVFTAVVGVLVFELVKPSPSPAFPPLPIPNGYDDFVKANKILIGRPRDMIRTNASTESLRAFIESNRQTLDLVRVGLSRQCGVPLESRTNLSKRLEQLPSFLPLTMTLEAEGKLAEQEGRTADAIIAYLSVIRLGHECARGGAVGDRLHSVTGEHIGLTNLRQMKDRLTASECRDVVKALQAIDAKREPLADIWPRDEAYMKMLRIFDTGVRERLWYSWFTITGKKQRLRQDSERIFIRSDAYVRLFMCGMAVRSFYLEHGVYPTNLADLVPNYLDAVPFDPFNSKPLRYRKTSQDFLLYSVGPDGIDDGGKPMPPPPAAPKGDLLFENPSPGIGEGNENNTTDNPEMKN
jgi:hypothetical protein